MLFFWPFYYLHNLKKLYHNFHEIIKQHITDKKKQINILQCFLKDHETFKSGVMAAENSALPSQK